MTNTGPRSEEKKEASEIPTAFGGDPLNSDIELDESQLDRLIDEESPDFLKGLSDIQRDKNIQLREPSAQEKDEDLLEEIELWENSHGWRRKVYLILPFMPRISCGLKKLWFNINRPMVLVRVYVKNYIFFLRTQGKESLRVFLKTGLHRIREIIASRIRAFTEMSRLQKISLILVFLGTIGTGFFIYRISTKGILHPEASVFLPSLDLIASETIELEPDEKTEPFYDNLRAMQNLILLPKMVVNLKRQGAQGSNPMAAFELFLEGDSPEVTIEAKDKEVYVRDAIQRVVETFTFETLETSEGKRIMSEKIKKEAAKIFSTGGVRKVYIKTLILKP